MPGLYIENLTCTTQMRRGPWRDLKASGKVICPASARSPWASVCLPQAPPSHMWYTDESSPRHGHQVRLLEPGLVGNSELTLPLLSPYKFEAPWNAFEFAAHAIRVSANVVIVSMAWLTHEDRSSFLTRPEEPDLDTLTYWVQRMEPLIRREDEEEVIVIFANRSGTEDDVLYAGTSAVLGIQDGEVTVYGLLGRGEEKLLIVDTSKPAMAKLQYRPEGDRDIFADSAQDEPNSDVISSSQSEGQDSADLQQLGTTQGSTEPNGDVVDQSDRCADGYMFDLSDVVSTASTDFSIDTGSPMSPRCSWKPTPSDLSSKSSAPGLSETDTYMDWRKWLGECRDRALGATVDNTASLDIESAPTMEFSALVEGLVGTKMAQEIAVTRPFSTKAGNIN